MKSILKKNSKILLLVAFFLILTNILSVTHPLVLKQILDVDFNDNNIIIILRNLAIYICDCAYFPYHIKRFKKYSYQ